MERITELYGSENRETLAKVIGGLVVATAGGLFLRGLLRGKRQTQSNADYPKDTVILHQLGRGPYAPSLTPFAVKLETYLRMAKIPYQNIHDGKRSSKGKWPWMEYNGESIADTAFCIAHLNKVRGIDLHARLTPEQRATALAFQRLLEENLYWALALERWVYQFDVEFMKKAIPPVPFWGLILRLFTRSVRKAGWGQGMARHSQEEVLEIARQDLKAIADFMGQKKFLMGDEPCETDCVLFGMLSQIYWQAPGKPTNKVLTEQFPSLVAYTERMKTTFWPDWDECITHGGTREATK